MNVFSIFRFTFQEAISRRLILAGILASLAFLALFGLALSFVYGKILETASSPAGRSAAPVAAAALTMLGLYAVNFLASFLALFLSVGAISGEVDAGTLHAVLARPIRRSEYVFGRWLAFLVIQTVYVTVMVGLLLVLARVLVEFVAPSPWPTIGLMALGAASLMTLSLFGSSLWPTLANGIVVFTLFGLGWLAGMIEYVGRLLSNEAMLNLGTAVSLLVPSDALWRGASFFAQPPVFLLASLGPNGGVPFFSTAPPPPALIVWSILYVALLVAATIRSFSTRDL